MQTFRKRTWLIGGIVALAMASATPALVHARDEEYDRSIDLKEAPRAVVDAVEHHAEGQKISELDRVHKADGREFYRAIIRVREHEVRDLRVTPDGQVIDQHDFKDGENWRDREREFDKDRH
jgi:hypothetical protein